MAWLPKDLEGGGGHLFGEMVGACAEALMAAEAQTMGNAGYGEMTPSG